MIGYYKITAELLLAMLDNGVPSEQLKVIPTCITYLFQGYLDGMHYIQFTVLKFGYLRLGLVEDAYHVPSITNTMTWYEKIIARVIM